MIFASGGEDTRVTFVLAVPLLPTGAALFSCTDDTVLPRYYISNISRENKTNGEDWVPEAASTCQAGRVPIGRGGGGGAEDIE